MGKAEEQQSKREHLKRSTEHCSKRHNKILLTFFPLDDSFPVPLASITCAEANASTLGNNQSKEITDQGEKELWVFFFSWLKAYVNLKST